MSHVGTVRKLNPRENENLDLRSMHRKDGRAVSASGTS